MDPITLQYLAEARLDELRREADQWRLGRDLPKSASRHRRLRTALGRRLIQVGERLASPRVVGSTPIGHQIP